MTVTMRMVFCPLVTLAGLFGLGVAMWNWDALGWIGATGIGLICGCVAMAALGLFGLALVGACLENAIFEVSRKGRP